MCFSVFHTVKDHRYMESYDYWSCEPTVICLASVICALQTAGMLFLRGGNLSDWHPNHVSWPSLLPRSCSGLESPLKEVQV